MSEPSAVWHALTTRQGRVTVVTFAAGVFLVALAGIALACVPWKGEMTVTGQSSGNSLTVHGDPTESMTYCPGKSYPAVEIDQNEEIEVSLAPTDECSSGSNKLDDGEYVVSLTEVGFLDDDGDGEYRDWVSDCMPEFQGTPTHQFADTITVTNGSGSGKYDMSEYTMVSSVDTPQEAAAICATKEIADPAQGNMAPITTP